MMASDPVPGIFLNEECRCRSTAGVTFLDCDCGLAEYLGSVFLEDLSSEKMLEEPNLNNADNQKWRELSELNSSDLVL